MGAMIEDIFMYSTMVNKQSGLRSWSLQIVQQAWYILATGTTCMMRSTISSLHPTLSSLIHKDTKRAGAIFLLAYKSVSFGTVPPVSHDGHIPDT